MNTHTDDLVKRLRARKMFFRMDNDPHWYMSADDFDDDCHEAAARIEALEGALKEIEKKAVLMMTGKVSYINFIQETASAALAASQEMKKAPPISERGQVD